jgi:hypothetical protein
MHEAIVKNIIYDRIYTRESCSWRVLCVLASLHGMFYFFTASRGEGWNLEKERPDFTPEFWRDNVRVTV